MCVCVRCGGSRAGNKCRVIKIINYQLRTQLALGNGVSGERDGEKSSWRLIKEETREECVRLFERGKNAFVGKNGRLLQIVLLISFLMYVVLVQQIKTILIYL